MLSNEKAWGSPAADWNSRALALSAFSATSISQLGSSICMRSLRQPIARLRDFEAMDPERMEEEFEEHIPLRNLRARSGILTGSRFGKDSASCAFRDDEFARAGSRAQTGARLGASGERSRRKPTNRY